MTNDRIYIFISNSIDNHIAHKFFHLLWDKYGGKKYPKAKMYVWKTIYANHPYSNNFFDMKDIVRDEIRDLPPSSNGSDV